MTRPALLLSLAVTVSLATAQSPCTRGATQNSNGFVPQFDGFQLATSKTLKARDTGIPGTVHTARCVHAVYNDVDSGNEVIRYRRSPDGGFSWEVAQTIWTAAAGETFDADYRLAVDDFNVYVVLTTNRDVTGSPDTTNNRKRVWAVGSSQQGLPGSWSTNLVSAGVDAPMVTTGQVNDQLDNCAEPKIAAAGGAAHVMFLADYQNAIGQGNQPSTNQDVYYQQLVFVSGNLLNVGVEELRLENTPSGRIDSDNVDVAAGADRGAVVCVTWQDFSQSLSSLDTSNDTWSKTSFNRGFDLPTISAHNHTTGTRPTLNAPRDSKVSVDDQNVYVLQEDSRNGTDDDVFLSVSNDRGQTWNDGNLASMSPATVDSDGACIAAQGGKVFIFYNDDRNGTGNVLNNTFCVVDNNAGADIIAGTQTESQITTRDTDLHGCDINGGVVAVALEPNAGSGAEGFALGYTYDDGASWRVCDVLAPGGRDVDSPDCAVTINRDVLGIWIDDGGSNNNAMNTCWTDSFRTPQLSYDTPGFAFKYECASATEYGDLALLLPSLAAPVSGGLALSYPKGMVLNFAPDGNTVALLGVLSGSVTQQGTMTWAGIPNFATIIGQDIYWTVVVIGRDAGRGFPDTFRQTP